MKREAVNGQKSKGKFVPPSDAALHLRPHLAEAVADVFWDDGSMRDPFTLSVNWSGEQVLLQLNDKEVGRSLSTTAGSLNEGLDLLEKLLASGGALPWRYWKKQAKGR